MSTGFTEVWAAIREDIRHQCKPGLRAAVGGLLFNVGLKVVVSYRLHRYLARKPGFRFSFMQSLLAYWQMTRGNCQISPRAEIGRRFLLPHPFGVVIGIGCCVGDDVTLWQHVTLGNDGQSDAYPVLEDAVRVYAGSSVIGGVRLGKGCVVGAHSLVTRDVAPEQVVYGIPARPRPSGNVPGLRQPL